MHPTAETSTEVLYLIPRIHALMGRQFSSGFPMEVVVCKPYWLPFVIRTEQPE